MNAIIAIITTLLQMESLNMNTSWFDENEEYDNFLPLTLNGTYRRYINASMHEDFGTDWMINDFI